MMILKGRVDALHRAPEAEGLSGVKFTPLAMTVGVFVIATGAVRLLREAGFDQAPYGSDCWANGGHGHDGAWVMSDPEPDELFRARLLRVVSEELRPFVRIAVGAELDAMGRKHNRFRTGVLLKGLDSRGRGI